MESKKIHHENCPQCHKKHLKDWKDLTPDEKFVAERLPMSADFTAQERQNHLFCTNCWYETGDVPTLV